MNAAESPMEAYVGTRPMTAVPMPIPIRVTMNVTLRPARSPSHPKSSAPTGRMRKPALKMTIVLRNSMAGLEPAKNLAASNAPRLPKI